MQFRILGPLEAEADGSAVPLGPAKQRALLGVLLLHSNEVVSTATLVDALWGERPPATAAKLIQVYVSRLRRALGENGGGILRTRPPGYLAALAPAQLDASQFEQLLAEARERARDGAHERALAGYEAALALWRGPVLADVEHESHVLVEAERLQEQRLAALTERVDCELELGRHRRVIAELETLTAQHPLQERFWAQLMVALYHAGRQSEALAGYQRARRALLDQVGLEPGPELRQLEKAILAHEPSLKLTALSQPTKATPPPNRTDKPARPRSRDWMRQRRIAAAAAVLIVLSTLASVAALLGRGSSKPALAAVPSDSVVAVDPRTNDLVDQIRLHTRPSAIAYGDDALWVGARDDGTLLRIDPRTHEIRTIGIGAPPVRIAIAAGFVWVLTDAHTLVQLRSATATLVRTVALPRRASVGRHAGYALGSPNPRCGTLTAEAHAAWIGCWLPVALRVDARTGAVTQIVAACAGGMTFDGRSVWCAGATVSPDLAAHPQGELSRIDPLTRRLTETVSPPAVGPEDYVTGLAAAANRIWATNQNGTLWDVDPTLGRAVAVVTLHHKPAQIATMADTVWTANSDATLSRIDIDGPTLVRTVPLGPYPRTTYPVDLAAGAERVWVAMH